MRILYRHGHPLLYLPETLANVQQTLSLYPAQTFRARLARSGIKFLLGFGVPVGRKGRPPSWIEGQLRAFLASFQKNAEDRIEFGILAGNPRAAGRRYIVLVFSADTPVAIVKCGIDEEARRRIRKEQSVLAQLQISCASVPKLLCSHEGSGESAFAVEYITGESPPHLDRDVVGKILGGWLRRDLSSLRLLDLSAIDSLVIALNEAGVTISDRMVKAFSRHVTPTIYHGDFAPWNIRTTKQGGVKVVDWERGEFAGVPAWDWFHYLVQPSMLVKKETPVKTLSRVVDLFGSPNFGYYSRRAGISDIQRELFLAYLLYSLHVLKPTEGMDATTKLYTYARSLF